MNIVSILGVCVISAVVITLLKQYKGEYAILISVVAGTVVFLSIIFDVIGAVKRLDSLLSRTGLETSYLSVALKCLGICTITGFIADLCRDVGQTALASRAELAGRCAVFIISMPLLVSLLETAYKFIG